MSTPKEYYTEIRNTIIYAPLALLIAINKQRLI